MARITKGITGRKINNNILSRCDKITLRKKILQHIEPARVFDAFCGAGRMFYSVWCDAETYVGCDMKWYQDERAAYVADNRRLMRTIDLNDFNVFDFDAYGSPWEQCLILGARREMRKGEKIGLVITDGTNMNLKLGGLPVALSLLTGLKQEKGKAKISGAGKQHNEISDMAIRKIEEMLNAKITHRSPAVGKKVSRMRYEAIIFEGLGNSL